ncbi:MAG: GNAT family N-acetyltransferase, partial [Actinomycetota bacterium]
MDGLTVSIDVDIRPLRDPDLSDLEWNGHQIAQVAAVRDARLRRGDEVIFLVAEANAYAVGRIGIDLTKRVSERVAHLWSFAVLPNLQRLG